MMNILRVGVVFSALSLVSTADVTPMDANPIIPYGFKVLVGFVDTYNPGNNYCFLSKT